MDGYLSDFTHLDGFQKWALICAAALTILYAVMRPLRRRKDPLARPATGGNPSLAAQREVEKQMTELLVELEQMARQMTAQIDTRSAKLEALIKEADERIAMLRSASPAALAGGGEASGTAAAAGNVDGPSTAPADPRHAEVYELSDQGLSARQIAQHLGRPHGEIELILALRSHRLPAAAALAAGT